MKLWPFSQEVSRPYINPKYGQAKTYTPDILEIERKRRVTVFVHDDMKKGGKLHDYISETSISGRWPTFIAYTVDPFYVWKKDLGAESYPVALSDQISAHFPLKYLEQPARIEGEVYSIASKQLIKLDFLRENGLQFFRKRVEIYIPHSKVIYSKEQPLPMLVDPARQTFEAYMYVGNGYYWDDQLGGVIPSSPVPRLVHSRKEIGIFTRFEI